MSLRSFRILLWILVGLAAAGAAILYVQRSSVSSDETEMSIGGPFVLTDQTGSTFDSRSLDGKPHVLFFGFTHCPDVCPNTLARLAKLRKQLGKGDDSFEIVLVSVDPERDTPAELADYTRLFNTPVIALTGTPQQIADVTRSFGIYARKVPNPDGGYSIDHSAQVLLFDGDGAFRGTIAFDETDEPALQKLRNITS
ncbi:SCO family protein [Sphingomonas sp. HDW15A]|uniref:SCO family protein n=1 Tax=Sphingomonas sp. HDW15A TaxID=2714942 RepID=UPI00140B7935|nr:SCO family protein [Sphingomonas sp. HDW15A]QIK95459.1 SCO family protein [Sphingomonas sp. HDW15A]